MFSRFLTRSVAQSRLFHTSRPAFANLQWAIMIPSAATEDTIREKLSEFGTISTFHLPKFPHGGHKLCAQVVYQSDDSADKFIKAAREKSIIIHGAPIGCRPSLDPASLADRMLRAPSREVTVLNLPLDKDETSEVTSLLSQFGSIDWADLTRYYSGPAGFAVVQFANVESAKKAFEAAKNGQVSISDQQLFIHYNDMPARKRGDNRVLTLVNDAAKVTEQQLKEWLKPFQESITKFGLKDGVVFSTEVAAFKAGHYLLSHPEFPADSHNPGLKIRRAPSLHKS